MTKNAALYFFFSGFDLPAYEENSVPDEPVFPYLTYEERTDSFSDSNGIPITVNLWYRSTSRVEINAKAEEISAAIGRGGVLVSFDDGSLWIKRGSPFSQDMADATDSMVKRKVISIQIEFFSEN